MVSANADDGSWFAERETLLAELARREAQWAARRPSAYRFHASWVTMSYYYVGDVVSVAGRPLVVCDTTGAPADPDTRAAIAVDVPALFESIRTALNDTTNGVMARFDATRGFPTYIQFDNRWISDVGYFREVKDFRPISEDEGQCTGR